MTTTTIPENYHPILFTDEMVRAILDGRKTQTRRIVKNMKGHGKIHDLTNVRGDWTFRTKDAIHAATDSHVRALSPFGVPDDVLWVREAWAVEGCGRRVSMAEEAWPEGWPIDRLRYRATDEAPNTTEDGKPYWWNSRPSIHLPFWAGRLFLKVKDVRLEQVRDISDPVAEGCPTPWPPGGPLQWFMDLWESINGVESWNANVWVWVVEFERFER